MYEEQCLGALARSVPPGRRLGHVLVTNLLMRGVRPTVLLFTHVSVILPTAAVRRYGSLTTRNSRAWDRGGVMAKR
jgi:hypothetical protein